MARPRIQQDLHKLQIDDGERGLPPKHVLFFIRHLLDNDGSAPLEQMKTAFKEKFSTRESVTSLLMENPEYFRLDDESGNVACVVNFGICHANDKSSTRCLRRECRKLHLCQYYRRGVNCKFGDSCKFGHDLYTKHNKDIIKEKCLIGINQSDIIKLLEINSSIRKFPSICHFHNHGLKCKHSQRGERCMAMHICLDYVIGTCESGNCPKGHNIMDKQPKTLLKKHGVDTERPSSDILHELRNEILEQEKKREAKKRSNAETSTSSDESEPTICRHNLAGKCIYGAKCKRKHYSTSYQWQYELNSVWEDTKSDENDHIEEAYRTPDNDFAIFGDKRIIFERMEMTRDGTGLYSSVRRLSTESLCKQTKSSRHADLEQYATKWAWYWQAENRKWLEYGKDSHEAGITSEVLESKYLDNPFSSHEFPGHSYKFNFKRMQEKNTETKEIRALRRRPKNPNRASGSHSESSEDEYLTDYDTYDDESPASDDDDVDLESQHQNSPYVHACQNGKNTYGTPHRSTTGEKTYGAPHRSTTGENTYGTPRNYKEQHLMDEPTQARHRQPIQGQEKQNQLLSFLKKYSPH